LSSEYILTEYVSTTPGQPYRLLPLGTIHKGGKAREVTKELLLSFRLPHFKPPIKLGSHADEAPAGGHMLGLEVRDDGLWVIPELNGQGVKALGEGAYRYHSPEVLWEGYLEDPATGNKIMAPLILGDALLHTPHLGEAAALYSIEEVKPMTVETVEVPKSFWEKFTAWFDHRMEEPAAAPEPEIEPEQFAAIAAERDEYKARIEALEAEEALKARVEKFGAILTETKLDPEAAGTLAGMTDEQADWVVQQFKALSAQIKESALISEIGTEQEAEVFDNPVLALDAAIHRIMEAEKVDYAVALSKAPAELKAAAYKKGG
ncbi:MAG: phage protease, partial [Gammaproteobacteria bacterium]|nr:phage protease [Gammaproteobacteria bacterium]